MSGKLIIPTNSNFTASGLPSIFDPSFLVPNVLGWWALDQSVTIDGSNNVLTIADLSGNGNVMGNPASPSNSLLYIPAGQNGKAIAQGNPASSAASNRWVQTAAALTAAAFSSITPFTYVIAMRRQAAATAAGLSTLMGNTVGSSISGAQLQVPQTVANNPAPSLVRLNIQGGSTNFRGVGSTALAANMPYTIVATYDGSGAGTGIKIYVNGVLETMTQTGSGTLGAVANSNFELGGPNTGQPNFTSADYIFEAVLLNVALTPAQAALMDTYLNGRWAIHS
jgi:hypothetical protein